MEANTSFWTPPPCPKNTEKMASPTHYSPAIDAFLVSALYHEARRRGVPMTRLADELLRGALEGTEGWRLAQTDPTSLAKRQGYPADTRG